MLLCDCIWNILNDLFQREIKFSNQQVNWYFYIVGWGKTGPAHSFPPPKCWDLSIYPLDFWIMLFFFAVSELSWLIPSRESSFQTNKFIRNCRVGKDWAGPFFPPSLIFGSFYWSFRLSVYVTLSLILIFMKDLFQSENQGFNPTRLLVLLHCGVGKNWAGPFFTPSKMFRSFYLSSRLLDYVILLLYHNSLDLYQAENQVFKPTSLFVCLFVCLIWFFTSTQQSFSYAGRVLLG